MKGHRLRVGKAISELTRSVAYYEHLDVDLDVLVAAWQELDPVDRIEIGRLAPRLVDGLLRVEDRVRGLADASA